MSVVFWTKRENNLWGGWIVKVKTETHQTTYKQISYSSSNWKSYSILTSLAKTKQIQIIELGITKAILQRYSYTLESNKIYYRLKEKIFHFMFLLGRITVWNKQIWYLCQLTETCKITCPLINKGLRPSSMRTESTSSTTAKWKGFGLFINIIVSQRKTIRTCEWKLKGYHLITSCSLLPARLSRK